MTSLSLMLLQLMTVFMVELVMIRWMQIFMILALLGVLT
jgi:hypothetical protein